MNVRVVSVGVSLALAVAIGCGGSAKRSGFGSDTDPNNPANGSSDGSQGFAGATGGTGTGNCTVASSTTDIDGDGYSGPDDCNECDVNINRGAYDFPGNGVDEDCDGTPDNEPTACDDGLDMAGSDPFMGAYAIGLCKKATDDTMWGVVDAKWVKPDGSALTGNQLIGIGILNKFGANGPQEGSSMLAMSSGTARAPSDNGYKAVSGDDKGYTSGTPKGYPKESPACPGVTTGEAHDGAGLQLQIRVPSNAKSFKYQQNFFTYEFPDFICSEFNDFFVAIMDPKPSALPDGNIAFDQDGNPISVNNSLLQVCTKQSAGGKSFPCPLGASTLTGTGFESHAATGWLTTTAPVDGVKGKTITLTFTVWDSGDGILDSSALVDDFEWSVDPASGAQTLPTPN